MVHIIFSCESHYQINRDKIIEACDQVLKSKIKRQSEISISIVGNRKMKLLNKKYRNLDKTTDVLSFPLSESSNPNVGFVVAPDNILRLGDIVISYPEAINMAKIQNTLVDVAINELVLHGLNHLLGIHHPE